MTQPLPTGWLCDDRRRRTFNGPICRIGSGTSFDDVQGWAPSTWPVADLLDQLSPQREPIWNRSRLEFEADLRLRVVIVPPNSWSSRRTVA